MRGRVGHVLIGITQYVLTTENTQSTKRESNLERKKERDASCVVEHDIFQSVDLNTF